MSSARCSSAAGKRRRLTMLIRNLRIEDALTTSDVRVEEGRFAAIEQHLESLPGEEVVDAAGRLGLPPIIESHVHLDSALTAGEPRWNESGTLFGGIEVWSERKPSLTIEDVKERVHRAVRQQARFGIQYVRTHVDVTDPDLTALRAMLELCEELKDFITLQIVAFPQEGIQSFPDGEALMRRAAEMGVDAIGAIPHFEFTREYSVDSLTVACARADEFDLLVGVHCDEIDDEASP